MAGIAVELLFVLPLMSGLRRPVFLRLCCGNLRFWVLDNCAARKPVSSVFFSARAHVWRRSLLLDNCDVKLAFFGFGQLCSAYTCFFRVCFCAPERVEAFLGFGKFC